MKGRTILRKEEDSCLWETRRYVSPQAYWGANVLKTLSETCNATGSKRAVSYCAGTWSWRESEDSVTLCLARWSNRAGKRRETAGTGSICCHALGSSKQDQSSNSLQMKPTGVWPPAGDQSTAMPQMPYTAAHPAAELQLRQVSLEDTLSCPRIAVVGHHHCVAASLRQRRELSPRYLPLFFVHLPMQSHRPAIFNATLGRNARPGQKAAEKALGLSIYPLGN